MTLVGILSRGRPTARSAYLVRPLRDKQQIRRLLEPDRAYAAYALAQLDSRYFGLSEWYLAEGEAGRALLLHSAGGLGRAMFAIGDANALDAILSLRPGPRFTFGSFQLHHKSTVERYFLMTRGQTMLRMSVTRDSFQPAPGQTVHLCARDVALVNRLYSMEGGISGYRAVHLEEGIYYGVFENGALVSIAGTHIVSYSEGVAVVGNVFTHPRYRGRGYGAAVTSAVTLHLLEHCPLVVLTVEAGNDAAVSIYRKLGYKVECALHETPLVRKDPIGLISLGRRFLARWRGGGEGEEVVIR
jgi:GNAT superfamily N-acetyltransferase